MEVYDKKSDRVLIIDDDSALTELVKEYLGQNRIEVIEAHDPAQGKNAIATSDPDLLLLDVMLPGKSGFELCREIRLTSKIPIVMLAARGGVTDRIHGFDLGADDYLAKPFEPRELLARVQAILRRTRHAEFISHEFKFENLTIDVASRTAYLNSELIDLTTAEFELLSLFISHPNETFSRDQISQQLKGRDWEALNRSVDVVMSRLRQKLGDDARSPRFFKTIWGTGYMFIGRQE